MQGPLLKRNIKMAVHKPEPLFVPPPLSELPSPGIGFLSSLRAKSKDLSIGTLTPACILIMSPSACAENKLDGYCVILASSLWINALGETWFYGVPTRDPLAFPCRSLRVSPSIASRRRGRGGFFGDGRQKAVPGGAPELELLFGGLNFTLGAKPRHGDESRSHACQGGDAMNLGAGLFIFRISLRERVGMYKYYSHATDNTGVFLNMGAKFDLALSGGSDAYLLARRWVGINPSLGVSDAISAKRGCY